MVSAGNFGEAPGTRRLVEAEALTAHGRSTGSANRSGAGDAFVGELTALAGLRDATSAAGRAKPTATPRLPDYLRASLIGLAALVFSCTQSTASKSAREAVNPPKTTENAPRREPLNLLNPSDWVQLPGIIDAVAVTRVDWPLLPHTCALIGTGQVYCLVGPSYCHIAAQSCERFGLPVRRGGCGPGPPQRMPELGEDVEALAGGCALKRDRTVWCDQGQRFVPVPGLADAVEIVAERGRGCARRAEGTVSCWSAPEPETPRNPTGVEAEVEDIQALEEVVELSGHGSLVCARSGSGRVACWRWGPPDAPPQPPEELYRVPGVDDAIDIDVGSHLCIVRASGALHCGRYSSAELFPVERVYGISDAREVEVSAEGDQCVLNGKGVVRCVGRSYPSPERYHVVDVADLDDAAQLELDQPVHCAVRQGGQRECWIPSTTEIPRARPVPELERARVVGACIVDVDGRVTCRAPSPVCHTIVD